MNIPLLDLKREYEKFGDSIQNKVSDIMASGGYIMGPEVEELEMKIAEYIGVKHAISCGNGTDALVLSLLAAGIGSGDEVITTTFTYYATAEAIANVGAKPVFIDVDPNTFNIDVEKIEEKINTKTKAIIPVHIFGQPCEMDAIMEIAEKYDLRIIEDVAQGIGAEYKNQKVGSFGDFGTFSFFPTKNLGAFGDGGMVVTNSDEYATVLKALRNHGSGQTGKIAYNFLNNIEDDGQSVTKYFNYLVGFNSRLDAIQAGILNIKFNYLDEFNQKRRDLAERYNATLESSKFKLPTISNHVKTIYHLYVIQSETRHDDIQKLTGKGISTGVYYPVPLHLQKVFEHLGYKKGDFPVSEYLSERTFAIPIFPEMTIEEQNYIINVLKEI